MQSDQLLQFLAFQLEAFEAVFRELWLLFRRQAGKSYLFACKALSLMMQVAGEAVFIINASLLMGRENILKESEVFGGVLEKYAQLVAATGGHLDVREARYKAVGKDQREVLVRESKPLPNFDPATLAELFEANALEARIWHSNTTYSRSRVVAANPATARGYTGHKLEDESGFIGDYEALQDAIEAISSRNPRFIHWRATTPPLDSSHPVYNELAPPADMIFTPNPAGNWYETADGIPVLRVDAYDADLAGVKMYGRKSKTNAVREALRFPVKGGEGFNLAGQAPGEKPALAQAISVAEARRQSRNKDHFDRNYLLKFIAGGLVAVPRHLLIHSQSIVPLPGCGTALDLGEIGDIRGEAA